MLIDYFIHPSLTPSSSHILWAMTEDQSAFSSNDCLQLSLKEHLIIFAGYVVPKPTFSPGSLLELKDQEEVAKSVPRCDCGEKGCVWNDLKGGGLEV